MKLLDCTSKDSGCIGNISYFLSSVSLSNVCKEEMRNQVKNVIKHRSEFQSLLRVRAVIWTERACQRSPQSREFCVSWAIYTWSHLLSLSQGMLHLTQGQCLERRACTGPKTCRKAKTTIYRRLKSLAVACVIASHPTALQQPPAPLSTLI